MKTYLAIPTSVIPEWTKQNIVTYPLGRFSNDTQFMLIDNAHPIGTYEKWLGPNFHLLESIVDASTVYTHEEILALSQDPESIWYGGA